MVLLQEVGTSEGLLDSSQQIDISFMLIVGTFGMLLLAISIISFIVFYQKRQMRQQASIQKMKEDYQRDLLDATFQTQEVERRRIAQDLHDEIGALLSTAKLSVNHIHKSLPEDSALKEFTADTKELMDDIITNVRKISKDLLPATLEEFGLVDAIQEMISKIKGGTDMKINYKHIGQGMRFNNKMELSLFRVVQELINNIIKHAEATRIDIELRLYEDQLTLTVQDDGIGFDYEAYMKDNRPNKGLGLKNIETRLGMYQTRVNFETAPGKGTQVRIDMNLI